MEKYEILFKPSVEKDLGKIQDTTVIRILEKIEQLSENPFPRGCAKLRGVENVYRIRQGNYRIIYSIDKQLKQIMIQLCASSKRCV
jgi:mRNA interferase RelE/StbE